MKKLYITHRTLYIVIACAVVLATAVILKITVATDHKNDREEAASSKTETEASVEALNLSEPRSESSQNLASLQESSVISTGEETSVIGAWENTIGVHVTGAVFYPDRVYLLAEGARIEDAIAMAGGAAKDADLSSLNLADYVHDGEKIYVPRVGEEQDQVAPEGYVTKSESVLTASEGENGAQTLTNLNLATKIELMELPGIGETMADRIIEYRETNGPFRSIDELINVEGIGENRFSKLKAYITI